MEAGLTERLQGESSGPNSPNVNFNFVLVKLTLNGWQMIFDSLSFLPSSVFCHTEGQGAPNSHRMNCSLFTHDRWCVVFSPVDLG